MSLLTRSRCVVAAGALVLTLALAPASATASPDLDLTAAHHVDATTASDEVGPEVASDHPAETDESEPADTDSTDVQPSDTESSGTESSDTPPSDTAPSDIAPSDSEPPTSDTVDPDPIATAEPAAPDLSSEPPISAADAEVHIPDPALRACVVDELVEAGHDADDPLTSEAMLDLWQIRCPSSGVKDLTGLEHASYVLTLKLADNALTDLSPLAGLEELGYVDISYNDISDLSPLTGNLWLYQVMAGHNDLTDITPLADLPSLFSLDLEGNQVSDVSPLSGSQQLGAVTLNFNPVTDLTPLIGKPDLFRLHLLDTGMTDLDTLRHLTTVEVLSVGNLGWYFERALSGDIAPPDRLVQAATGATPNRITDFSALASLPGLRELTASGLELTDLAALTPHLMPGLGTVDISGNHLSDLTPLASLTGLTQVSANWQTIDMPSTTVDVATSFAPVPLGSTPALLTVEDGPVTLTEDGWTFTSAGSAELSWTQNRQTAVEVDPAWPVSHYAFSGTVRQQATDQTTAPTPDPEPMPQTPDPTPDPGPVGDEQSLTPDAPDEDYRSEVLADPTVSPGRTLAVTGTSLTAAWVACALLLSGVLLRRRRT